jgi:Second Messenger Oligonucleotide or Dinucleotide Synthetase domain
MKLVTASTNSVLDEILDLIATSAQLTATQFDRAKISYRSVGKWLDSPDSSIRAYRPAIFAQGSLAFDTTVKPLSHTEFDLDLVCLIQVSDRVSPATVYDFLLRRMLDHGTYAKIAVEMPRCIRLDYSGEFHLDIVPAVPDSSCRPGETFLKIPDRERHVWLPSNPMGYVSWFDDQAARRMLLEKHAEFSRNAKANVKPLREPLPAYSKPPLKVAVQLLKRWRDVAFKGRENLQPSSIILTTLAGYLYGGENHPTDALTTILDGIYKWANTESIRLQNPSNPKEWITDRWAEKPAMYDAFLAEVFALRVQWQKLIDKGRFPDFVADLKILFTDVPVTRALKKFAEVRGEARSNGTLFMEKGTGILGVAAAPATLSPGMKVKGHAFHGS